MAKKSRDGNNSGGSSSGNTGGSTHLFPAPRVIPRVVNGSLVGAFLPQTLIPPDHPQRVIIEWAAKLMRESQWYSMRQDHVEHRIYLLVTCDPASMMHHVELIMKCHTIRLGISTECFTYQNDGVDVEDCPSHGASMAVSDTLPSPGISYGNGMTFLVMNAWILCRSKNGHCDEWTILEAEKMSFFLMIYIMVLNHYQISTMILNFGGTNAARHFSVIMLAYFNMGN